jgi:hypothetical protein
VQFIFQRQSSQRKRTYQTSAGIAFLKAQLARSSKRLHARQDNLK